MGILGKVLATTNDTLAYTTPSSRKSFVTINVANINTTDAEVKATISIRKNTDYEIGSITVNNGGSNYVAKPNLAIDGATGDVPVDATAEVVSMFVSSFDLANIGQGYNVGNILTASDASNKISGDVNVAITVTAVDGNGGITGFIISTNGVYQNDIPGTDTITLDGGTGTTAELNVSSLLYGIVEITVTNPGDDYIVVPTVVSGGDADLTAVLIADNVSKYDALDYEVAVPKSGTLERTGIILGAGDSVFVKSEILDSLNVIVFGVEEIA